MIKPPRVNWRSRMQVTSLSMMAVGLLGALSVLSSLSGGSVRLPDGRVLSAGEAAQLARAYGISVGQLRAMARQAGPAGGGQPGAVWSPALGGSAYGTGTGVASDGCTYVVGADYSNDFCD